MLLRKPAQNLADLARLGEHVPDFGSDLIEVKIGAGTDAQDNNATINVGRGQCVIPHQDTVVCDTQAAGLHCCAAKPDSVRFNSAGTIARYERTRERPSRTRSQASLPAPMVAAAREDPRLFRFETRLLFQRQSPPS